MEKINDVFRAWESDVKPLVVEHYGPDDYPALAESWGEYTDDAHKDGRITCLQYHYCPAWDDDMPDDDCDFILAAMGVEVSATRVDSRPDKIMGDMPRGSSHWRFRIARAGQTMDGYYSMGPAHIGPPEAADIVGSILMDISDIDGTSFEDWADGMGLDTDSRKALACFEACQEELLDMRRLFSSDELDDLSVISAGY